MFDEIIKNSRASITDDELSFILEHVSKIKPKVVVEIGVHLGYSMDVWQEAFKPCA
jgi:predicted O-methyltransferase YrrM